MTIQNFTQFVHLLTQKQILHMHPAFDRLATCMIAYNGMCSCGGNSNKDKSDKHAMCNRIYREAIGAVNSIKAHLFNGCADSTISFSVDHIYHIKTLVR